MSAARLRDRATLVGMPPGSLPKRLGPAPAESFGVPAPIGSGFTIELFGLSAPADDDGSWPRFQLLDERRQPAWVLQVWQTVIRHHGSAAWIDQRWDPEHGLRVTIEGVDSSRSARTGLKTMIRGLDTLEVFHSRTEAAIAANVAHGDLQRATALAHQRQGLSADAIAEKMHIDLRWVKKLLARGPSKPD